MDKRMLFVLGNPRSGTSLLRLMLTNHPDICIPPECGFIQWWHRKYGDWKREDIQNPERVNQFISDLKTSKKIETWNLDFKKLAKKILEEQPIGYAQLCECVIDTYASQVGKEVTFLGDKNNYYLDHLPLISSVYPGAFYVTIVRDGRDVALSYQKIENLDSDSPYKPTLPSSIPAIAEEWKNNIEKVDKHYHQVEEEKKIWIRYEDLVSNPAHELDKICTLLTLPYSDEMLDYHVKNKKTEQEPESTLDWKRKTLKKPDSSNIKKYKNELNKEDISAFNKVAGEQLSRFGYE